MTPATLALALAVLMMAGPAQAGTAIKHSGQIVTEDLAHQKFTVEEMGPWHGPGKGLTGEVVYLTSETRIKLAARPQQASVGWPGGFSEEVLKSSDIEPGDFVTVTVEQRGGRPVATAITVVRPPGS